MRRTKVLLAVGASLVLIGTGTALAVASNDDPEPQPPADTILSQSELDTFDSLEADLVKIETFPGFIAVYSPDGPLGYVKTADVMAQVRVPMGESGDPDITLYDAEGQAIGVWHSTGPADGWTTDEGDAAGD